MASRPSSGTLTTPRQVEFAGANSRPPSGEVQPGQPRVDRPGGAGRRNFTWLEREVEQGLLNLKARFDRLPVGDGEGPKDPARWRYKIVETLNSVPIHTLSTVLLMTDLILVVISLEIYIQILILKARAVDFCLQEYEAFRAIPLPLVNTDCNTAQLTPCDPTESDEYYIADVLNGVEVTIAIASCLILCTFLAESILYIAALGVSFFKSFFFVFDLVVVLISLALEIWAIVARGGEQLIVGFFIVARMWRFLRVPHNVYILDHAEAAISSAERASSRNPTPTSFTPASTNSPLPPLVPSHLATQQGSGPIIECEDQ